MGFWGSSLYANDCCCDVRDCYTQFLQSSASNTDAYKKTLEAFSEYLNTDEEPLFWYALADTQWRVGRLEQDVKEMALFWIQRQGGINFWAESKHGGIGWVKTLDKLKNMLNQPQPCEKKFKNPCNIPCNPWNIGDVYAYCFHTEAAKEAGYWGKYILLQKLSDEKYMDGRVLSHVRVFDKLFDRIPNEVRLEKMRLLPFDVVERFMPNGRASCFPKLDMSALLEMSSKRHYPKKHLLFIGNYSVPEKVPIKIRWGGVFFWLSIERTLLTYHQMWQNYNYQLLENESIVSHKTEAENTVQKNVISERSGNDIET